ncbi:MAG: phosphate propanoyltransferase [Gemmatimonadales bacterium]
MTPEEIQDLAARIADLLARRDWLPGTVRPEPPGPPTPGALPPWAAAGQQLSDVAPVPGRRTSSGRHRPSYDGIVAAARCAAAGRAPAPMPGGEEREVESAVSGRVVPIAVSNRHIHVSAADFARLYGPSKEPTPDRPITQPGQFAANERVRVVGPRGAIDNVRIVAPTRATTQVELSVTDCRAIGIDAPVRGSGDTAGSAAVRLEGPVGAVDLREGAIVAARHLHVSEADASKLGLADGDRVSVALGQGDRRATIADVLVRSGKRHATELHLDTDEARAFGVGRGDTATILGRPRSGRVGRSSGPRKLVKERDVSRFAAAGETLCDNGPFIVTPAARDRAKALGIWRDKP